MYTPKYWPSWLALGLLRFLSLFPFSLQLFIGRQIGRLFYRLAGRRRLIASKNIDLCFSEKTAEERAVYVKRHFESVGMSIFETAMAWWAGDSRLKKRVEIEGLEHFQKALDSGSGVILLSAHFTTLEIGGRLLSMFAPFHVLYRRHENPAFEATQAKNRENRFEKAIPREDMRAMLQSLKQGKAVWFAPDQNFGHKNSIFAEFFGVKAATNTATSRLAKMTKAKVIPFSVKRLENGKYRLKLEPEWQDYPTGDVQEDTQRMNDLIEIWVREAPEQYLWMHRRFKDRPEGEERFY